MLKYLILFITAAASSFLLTPLVRSFAIKLGVMDLPEKRKVHDQPVPRLGGFSIFITFILVLLTFSQFNYFRFLRYFLQEIEFLWIFIASIIVLGMGAVDDFKKMPPSVKFFFQIIAGLIVALTCYKIEVISSPFGSIPLGMWSIPATVLWVVAITNAINLLDGLDGLAAGTAFIVCLAMFGISLFNQNIGIALCSIILAGSILGFLKYNFHPASIFLGDSGAYFLGFILSVLPLLGGLKGPTTLVIIVPILALGLPIMDTALSMFRRLLKSLHIMEVDGDKNVVKLLFVDGWSMFRADRDHIHHRLIKMGFTQRKAVVFLYLISLFLGGMAFSFIYFKNMNYALFLATIVIASYIGIRKLGYTEIQFLRNGALLPFFDAPGFNFKILRIFVDMGLVMLSYYLAFLLRFEGEFDPSVKEYYLKTIPLVLPVKLGIFYFSSLYKGAWRYIGVSDLIKILKAVVFGCIASALLLWIIPAYGIMSRAALLIDFNLLLFFVIGERSSFRILEHLYLSRSHRERKVLIYGVGKGSVHALNEFINNPRLDISPVGFIDDDQRNQGKRVNGYPVLGSLNSLEKILENNSVSEIVIIRDDISEEKLERLSQICSSHDVSLRRFQTRLEEIPFNGQAV